MIYICKEANKQAVPTTAFTTRGLSGLTVGSLSDIQILGKANETQLAYSGYKDNIEAFLYATAFKVKVNCSEPTFPLPNDYEPTVPIPYPATVFRLAKKASPESMARMQQSLHGEGYKTVQMGKGDPAIILERPSFKTLSVVLPRIASPRIGNLEHHSQVEGSSIITKIYQCIDLFCRVNTYSYRKEKYQATVSSASHDLAESLEIRMQTGYYREGYSSKSKVPKRSEVDQVSRVERDDKDEMTPWLTTCLPGNQPVLVAKPSPLPSTTSWGTPSSVPNSAGLIFPYFAGMLHPDSRFIRDVAGRRFFKNLGEKGESDPRSGYKEFRSIVGTVASTAAGIILGHILCGIDLALETQTQCFLLFDRDSYMGFCLLGEEFSVFAHGKWHLPLTAQSMREQLASLQTHDQALDALVEKFSECLDLNGDAIIVSKSDIECSSGLADTLAKVRVDEDSEMQIREIRNLLERVHFPTTFKRFAPLDISWAIDQMTVNLDSPLDPDVQFFIPLNGWHGINTKVYKILASFGPRSFSFRNAKGTELALPRLASDTIPWESRDESGKLKNDRVVVYEKAVRECVKDWTDLLVDGRIRVDYTERAIASRAHVFKEKNLETITKSLITASLAGIIGTGKRNAGGEDSGQRGVKRTFGDANLDEFF